MTRLFSRLRARLTGLHRRQEGITVAELTVTLLIVSIVGAMSITLLTAAQRADVFTADDTAALDDLRHASEALSKELRQARMIYPASTARSLYFWVDYDRDNQQDTEERITWQVDPLGGGEARLIRFTDAGPSTRTVAREFLEGDAFTYQPPFPDIPTVVGLVLRTEVTPGSAPGERLVETMIRIRNEATR
jgi:type II secretory pathway pseudopilin PulG